MLTMRGSLQTPGKYMNLPHRRFFCFASLFFTFFKDGGSLSKGRGFISRALHIKNLNVRVAQYPNKWRGKSRGQT